MPSPPGGIFCYLDAMTIASLRTPEERFRDLDGFPYEPRYEDVGDGLRMAYVDEGPTQKRTLPRAQGRATRIFKRTSHVTVVVDER